MKDAVVLILVLSLALCGCDSKSEKESGDVPNQLPIVLVTNSAPTAIDITGSQSRYSVYKVTIEDHDYFFPYHGGMIHSASCRCRELEKTK